MDSKLYYDMAGERVRTRKGKRRGTAFRVFPTAIFTTLLFEVHFWLLNTLQLPRATSHKVSHVLRRNSFKAHAADISHLTAPNMSKMSSPFSKGAKLAQPLQYDAPTFKLRQISSTDTATADIDNTGSSNSSLNSSTNSMNSQTMIADLANDEEPKMAHAPRTTSKIKILSREDLEQLCLVQSKEIVSKNSMIQSLKERERWLIAEREVSTGKGIAPAYRAQEMGLVKEECCWEGLEQFALTLAQFHVAHNDATTTTATVSTLDKPKVQILRMLLNFRAELFKAKEQLASVCFLRVSLMCFEAFMSYLIDTLHHRFSATKTYICR
jgi:hypothetical protein